MWFDYKRHKGMGKTTCHKEYESEKYQAIV
jgi:hypothetical protein